MLINEFEWKPEYELGVAEIDNAHHEIFIMAKKLYFQSYRPHESALGAKNSLEFLKNYVIRHFEEEEAYMRQIAYPGYMQHVEQHAKFRDKILPRLENDLRSEHFSGEIIYRFLTILRLWITRHILIYDLALGEGVEPAQNGIDQY